MALESLKDVLSQLLTGVGLDDKNLAATSILENELQAWGSFAHVVGIKNRCVYIEVESSVHFQEYSYRKMELLKKISDMAPLKGKEVWDIKLFLKGSGKSPKIQFKPRNEKEKIVYRTIRTGARKKKKNF